MTIIRLVEVYEIAAYVHQVLDRFASVHGTELLEKLVPEVTFIFEQLESLLRARSAVSDQADCLKDELNHIQAKTVAITLDRISLAEKFNHDFDGLIRQWRNETRPMEIYIAELTEFISKLSIQIANRKWDLQHLKSATGSNTDHPNGKAVYHQIWDIISDIKDTSLRKEQLLTEIHQELDQNLLQIQVAIEACRQAKENNYYLRKDNARLQEQRNELVKPVRSS